MGVLVNQLVVEISDRSNAMPFILEAKSARDKRMLKPVGLTSWEKNILTATP